ncbi:hypothetical protein PWG71_21480 [Nocardiopsis sp. N85]|uniref:hypothetical protein n=1 Tax=Nocardiopsis sp. N85 TaxID=3029400 RepID=UPI00237F41A2|nr:hypothetical protein [Nocardiopsis sp. N85]MDE3723970.1 hypothetical protein [Nocardiopsis sp. N85]
MTSLKTPTKSLAVASGAALLTLTACSGGAAAYEFAEPLTEPTQRIEFRVPEELVELNEEYAETRVLESVTVSSTESEEPGRCSVEFRFEYVDGGPERLLTFLEETSEGSAPEEDRMASRLTGSGPDSIEFGENYGSAVVSRGCATSPTDDETTVEVNFPMLEDGSLDNFAQAEVSVMQGGELFIHEPEIDDWQLDSNGNWIQ